MKSLPDGNTNVTVRVVLGLTVYLTICNTVAQFMQISYHDPAWIIWVLGGCITAIVYDTYKRKALTARAVRVLLVEDSVFAQGLIKQELQQNIWCEQVVTVDSGGKALDLLSKGGFKPDLILLDLTLPDMRGADLLNHIKNSSDNDLANTPVVIITAQKKPDEGDLLLAGSKAWIEKGALINGALTEAVKTIAPAAVIDKKKLLG